MSHPDRRAGALIRRLGLLDAMILVFALAPAFLILRDRYDFYRTPRSPDVYATLTLISAVSNSILMALTLAITLIVLRKPRRKLSVVLRRPGAAACVAASLGVVVMTLRMTIKTYAMHSQISGRSFEFRYVLAGIVGEHVRIGFAVLGAWLMLLVTRTWRFEPTFLDRAGRVLGWAWIALLVFHLFVPWIEPYLPAS